MKILMICTEKLPVPPIRGGAIQTYISGTLSYLKDSHNITVLGVEDPSLSSEETVDGIHYVRIPGKVFEIYRQGVTEYLKSNEFDLIHIFNRPKLVLPVRQVAPESKITLSMHNDMFNESKIDPEEAAKVLETVSSVATISNYIGDLIKQQYTQAAGKVYTIYSGVDSQRFLPGYYPKMESIRNRLRKEHGLENKTVILYAGRLSRNKGVDRLIRALPDLSKRFKDLALVIVGSNWFSQNRVTDFVAYVRALAKKLTVPVVHTGFVSPYEIQNWFAAADLFVCTSIWQEPLARVHYEAMASGLPIVTTARGGNAEVIFKNENGLIVENPEDPANFVEKITEILSDKSKMRRMGEKGRELAVLKYNWERVADDILKLWDAVPAIVSAESEETITEDQPKQEVENGQTNNTEIVNVEIEIQSQPPHEEGQLTLFDVDLLLDESNQTHLMSKSDVSKGKGKVTLLDDIRRKKLKETFDKPTAEKKVKPKIPAVTQYKGKETKGRALEEENAVKMRAAADRTPISLFDDVTFKKRIPMRDSKPSMERRTEGERHNKTLFED
ncbi:MAG: glycosyltransferase family 4 protein [Tuberibacillus sp.]